MQSELTPKCKIWVQQHQRPTINFMQEFINTVCRGHVASAFVYEVWALYGIVLVKNSRDWLSQLDSNSSHVKKEIV